MGTQMVSVQKRYASMSQTILKFGGDGTLKYFYPHLEFFRRATRAINAKATQLHANQLPWRW
jgi:hypothetical protein